MATHVSLILKSEPIFVAAVRAASTQTAIKDVKHYPMVVLGGGAGGCSVAARACRMLDKGSVAVVDSAQYHYYQPMWTLVGAGIKNVKQSAKLMSDVLPKECVHFPHKVAGFDPEASQVTLTNGQVLSYRHLVVALGLQLNYDRIEGLLDALKHDPMVCSNYWRETVEKTFPAFKAFKGGNAIFTFPNTPVKCAGAPQKIMYLADEFWRKSGVRDKTNIHYKLPVGEIFKVKKYAERLAQLCDKRGINVDYKRNLVAVNHTKKEATFQKLDTENLETEVVHYDFMHIPPPMSAPDVLKNSKVSITDGAGFLDVNKHTLQHAKYNNIFGLGDCTNLPTSKTAAAVASQNEVLVNTLKEVMKGQKPTGMYDGYTSCPIVTGYKTCILAEFGYDEQPLETFPFDQGKERRTMFHLKKDVFPWLYWSPHINGYWGGPKPLRKVLRLGF